MDRKISFQGVFFQQSIGSGNCLTYSRGFWYNKLLRRNLRVLSSSRRHKDRQIPFRQICLLQEGGYPEKSQFTSTVPDSLNCLSENSVSALTAAIGAGYRRLLIDIDLQQGDPTYTTFKSVIPFLREFLRVLEGRQMLASTSLLFPDEGSAAFARKDWNISDCAFFSFASYFRQNRSQGWLIMICPSAVDVEVMEQIIDRESPFLSKDARPTILINPNLVDMGATGLGFNARQLRQRLLGTFESVYFFRVYTWGVLVRQYPFNWSIWFDTENTEENSSSEEASYRLLGTFGNKPSDEAVQETLMKFVPKTTKETQTNWFHSFLNFLKWFSKG
ncbi:hypothetical protein GpartN1_g3604.t1 [Galdieria partita]|uniref:DUF1995 domain-containing protein n=1 Tax=Galdieria partita TaxID=83374 RepID=A0A9C7UQE5_9RHOD|nr:hypothetical protein GpartN1_g3604.t1 [Galdieria partita]